jgi:hypothetical protein
MKRSLFFNSILVGIFLIGGMSPAGAKADGPVALKVSENHRYFVGADGYPLFWQGDTEWELFHLFSVEDAKALLLERHKQGFNVVQVMATGVYPEWGAAKGMKPWNEMQAWLDNNPLTPNEAYFERADAIVAAANEYGIVLVIGVYHARDNDEGRINTGNAKAWAKWLAGRYKNASNIVWSMYPHADSSSEPVVRAAVQGILEADGGAHLITMHPDPSPTSSSFMHTEFWLSFNTLQTWSTDFMNYDMVRADFLRIPAKPVVNGEARYEEEDGTTALQVRRAGYWACLAGGFYSYGHRDNWASPQTWRGWYDSPGAKQMKVMGDLFRSIKWWHLVPDRSIFSDWATGNVAARSSDGDWILAYLTGTAAVNVKLSSITASDSVSAWWIDPLTGARTKIGVYPTSRSKEFTPPSGWQDAILFVEKEPK